MKKASICLLAFFTLDPGFEDQHPVVGFGDFAHDVGEAGVALWRADLEGVDQSREADGADRSWAFARGWIAWVEPIQFEQEALGRSAEVVADHVEAHAVVGIEDLLEVAKGFAHTGFGIADAEDRVVEHRA